MIFVLDEYFFFSLLHRYELELQQGQVRTGIYTTVPMNAGNHHSRFLIHKLLEQLLGKKKKKKGSFI